MSSEVFVTRFSNAIRFSRNILEKKDFPQLDIAMYMKIIRREQLETQEDEDIVGHFIFTLPGLNWILPASWEYRYKCHIQKKIKIYEYDQEGLGEI